MARLRSAMSSRYKERNEDVKIHTPRNLETLQLSFRGERVAKVSLHSIPSLVLQTILLGHWDISR